MWSWIDWNPCTPGFSDNVGRHAGPSVFVVNRHFHHFKIWLYRNHLSITLYRSHQLVFGLTPLWNCTTFFRTVKRKKLRYVLFVLHNRFPSVLFSPFLFYVQIRQKMNELSNQKYSQNNATFFNNTVHIDLRSQGKISNKMFNN